MTDKIKQAREALDNALWKGEPCHNPEKGWITSRGKRITRLGNRNAFGKLIDAHNTEIEYIRSRLHALEKLEAIDGKALVEAIEWTDKNPRAVTMTIDEAKYKSMIVQAARAVAEIKGE